MMDALEADAVGNSGVAVRMGGEHLQAHVNDPDAAKVVRLEEVVGTIREIVHVRLRALRANEEVVQLEAVVDPIELDKLLDEVAVLGHVDLEEGGFGAVLSVGDSLALPRLLRCLLLGVAGACLAISSLRGILLILLVLLLLLLLLCGDDHREVLDLLHDCDEEASRILVVRQHPDAALQVELLGLLGGWGEAGLGDAEGGLLGQVQVLLVPLSL
mmetsp:Transcript_4447/g.15619  ORF Transcript_4447/g.15619 Transcript_4447/m.15619 type:complete len:215 (-) Transcript_4447:1125-1769(-)